MRSSYREPKHEYHTPQGGHKCTDMPALAHKCTHTHRSACMHARTRTHTHMHVHRHVRMHLRVHAHTHTLARTHAHTHTHKQACTHSSVLVQHFGQGHMLFYRLVHIRHICVAQHHRYSAIIGTQIPPELDRTNFPTRFLPGSIVHGTLHVFQIRCRNSFGTGEFWQI